MASASLVAPSIAKVAGYPATSVLRMVRELQGAGLAPLGTHGRGKREGQFEPPHLANVLLAFAGPQPVDAAETVRLLRPVPLAASHRRPPTTAGSLGEAFEGWIDAAARGRLKKPPVVVELSLNPRMARVTWSGREEDVYLPAPGEWVAPPGEVYRHAGGDDAFLPRLHRGGAVRKRTHLMPELIFVAGQLWADTLQNRPDLAPERTSL